MDGGQTVIEILDQQTPSCSREIEVDVEVVSDWSLPAVAYAAFFTESERNEIGTFDELPAPERARWESVAAHIARTVVSPVDEDLEAWRAEQRTVLAERVRDAPYSRELWRAMTRTTDMQKQIAALRDLLIASRASIATAPARSGRHATSVQTLEQTRRAPARSGGASTVTAGRTLVQPAVTVVIESN